MPIPCAIYRQHLADEIAVERRVFIEISGKACIHKSVFRDQDLARSHLRELTDLRGTPRFKAYVRDLSERRSAAIASAFGPQWCCHAE